MIPKLNLCSLFSIDGINLGLGEFEIWEFGHVDTFTASVALGQFVQFGFEFPLDFWGGIH